VLRRGRGNATFPKRIIGDKPGLGSDLVKGTLDVLILKSLARGRKHGYAIAASIKLASADVLRVEEGALYPALHRLELRGMLRSEWGASDNNRRAKFYALTAAGRKNLSRESVNWQRLAAAVARVLELPSTP
jgi:transcriptional regulator